MFQEMETPKKFLIFSQKNPFLIFKEMGNNKKILKSGKSEKQNTLKTFLIFREMKLSYISGGNFQSLKIKTFLYTFLIKKQNVLN